MTTHLDDERLDRLERGAFGYFLDETSPDNGLVADAFGPEWAQRRAR